MLPRIVLILMQLGVGWSLAPQVRALIPVKFGALDVFLLAVIVAVLVWLTGHIGGLVLKDTPAPSPATLSLTVVLALMFAGLTMIPQVTAAVANVAGGRIPLQAYPLIGAIIGYAVRR